MTSRKKRLCVWLAVLTLCGVLCGVCALPGSAASPTAHKTIRVAMLAYPNFLDYGSDGKLSGFAYDYLRDIAKYTGWEYDYVPMSFTEAQTALERGDIDIVPGSQYTEERAARYDYSEYPMTTNSNVLCVRAADNRYFYNDFDALRGKTIGVMAGSIREQQFSAVLAQHNVTVQFRAFDTDEVQQEALESGEVDAVLMASMRCTSDYRIIASTNASDVYFTCNPKDPSVKADLDAAQAEILSFDPYYNMKLYEKHYGNIPTAYAFSQEERDYLKSAPALTVALSPDMKPYEYYDKDEKCFAGFVTQYFSRLSEITGLSFCYVTRGDEASTVDALNDGSIQLVASLSERGNAEEIYPVLLTDTYYSSSADIAYNRSVEDPLDIRCTVVVKNGFVHYQKLAEAHGYQHILYRDTLEECIEAVNRGEADLTYLPGYSASRMIDHAYDSNVRLFSASVSEFECAIGVSKSCDPLVVSILDKALAAIPQSEKNALVLEAVSDYRETRTLRDMFYENLTTMLCVILIVSVAVGGAALYSAERRKRMNAQLSEARDAAETANAAKSDFLSRMSHDMRTPMNGILGLTAVTRELPGLPQEAKENLAAIDDSSRYLLNLVNDVLDVNCMERTRLKLSPAPLEPRQFAHNLLVSIRPLADEKGVALKYSVIHSELFAPGSYISADRIRLQQILVNILSNAIKFTPAGGVVRVETTLLSCAKGCVSVRISVEDTGIGMSEEFLPHLFEPFAQEDSSAELNFAGTGLGMSIVKSLVTLMGGTIRAESRKNVGTKITVELAFACVAAPPCTAPAEPDSTVLAGKRILLAEDHPLNARIAIRLLEKKRMTVEHVEDGRAAVERFRQSPPGYFDAVLMDIRMPVMDGLAAARAIRALSHPDAVTVPILAMTANAFEEDRRKSLEAGMNEHLTKPIEPQKLYEALIRFTANKTQK